MKTLGVSAISVVSRPVAALFHGFLDLVYPPVCAWCSADLGETSSSQERLCEACIERLAERPVYRCPKCAAKVAPTFQDGDCPWCRSHELRFDRTVTIGSYDDDLRNAILRLKRPGNEALAAALVDLLWHREQARLQLDPIDVVAAVPMHWRRRIAHGYNGPEFLATRLAPKFGARFDRRLLARRRHTRPQVGLSPPQRRENVHNAFTVRRGRNLKGKRVLLVDDVLTSGATCSEAARVLKRAGAAAVVVAVLARAQGEV